MTQTIIIIDKQQARQWSSNNNKNNNPTLLCITRKIKSSRIKSLIRKLDDGDDVYSLQSSIYQVISSSSATSSTSSSCSLHKTDNNVDIRDAL